MSSSVLSEIDIEAMFPAYCALVPRNREDNLEWRLQIHRECKGDEKAQADYRALCSKDLLFYVNGFCYLLEPRTASVLPFVTWEFQNQAFGHLYLAITEQHDLVIEKSRDMGASWMCLTTLEWFWHFHELNTFLMLSRKEELVDKRGDMKALFQKVDFIHKHLPNWLMPNVSRMKMHKKNLDNSSSIDGESTNEFAGVGDRKRAILNDEFSKMENQQAIFTGTRDVANCRIFNFTPNGAGNTSYKIAHNSRFKKLTLHWSLHPEKRRGLYRWSLGKELEKLDEDWDYDPDYKYIRDGKLRSVWYDSQCERAQDPREIAQELDIDYQGSVSRYFDEQFVSMATAKTREPLLIGELEYDTTTGDPIGFVRQSKGRLRLWFNPDAAGQPARDIRASIGCDIAAGTGASNSVIHGTNRKTGEQIFELASSHIRPTELAEYAVALARWLSRSDPSGAYLIWEAPGPGRDFGLRVRELGYGNIYYRRQEASVSRKMSDVPGWWPTKDDRRSIYSQYRRSIESGEQVVFSRQEIEELRLIIFYPSGWILHQSAKQKNDPAGADENHGDRPTAGALAWKGVNETGPVIEDDIIMEPPKGSIGWRMKQARSEELQDIWW